MRDADLRGIVLQKFYDERHRSGFVRAPFDTQSDPVIITNICRQLSEHGLIEWKPAMANPPQGMGRITAHGVDVVEGTSRAAIAVHIDQSVSVSGSHVQIGSGNIQHVSIDIEKITTAIDHSTATTEAKAEAKSLLARFLENPIIAAIAGGVASSD